MLVSEVLWWAFGVSQVPSVPPGIDTNTAYPERRTQTSTLQQARRLTLASAFLTVALVSYYLTMAAVQHTLKRIDLGEPS